MLVLQHVALPKPCLTRRTILSFPIGHRSLLCRAEQSSTEAPAKSTPTTAPPTTPEAIEVKKVEAKAPLLEKGQGTAIVTGAISAILGIAYLALVWLLDSRGGQMLPPPPEAFLP